MCGVPQGSIHCSLIFILYINWFESCSKDLKCVQYVDDITVHAKGKSISGLATKLSQYRFTKSCHPFDLGLTESVVSHKKS